MLSRDHILKVLLEELNRTFSLATMEYTGPLCASKDLVHFHFSIDGRNELISSLPGMPAKLALCRFRVKVIDFRTGGAEVGSMTSGILGTAAKSNDRSIFILSLAARRLVWENLCDLGRDFSSLGLSTFSTRLE